MSAVDGAGLAWSKSDRVAPAAPGLGWVQRACVALFGFGMAADVMIATWLGAGGAGTLAASAVLGLPIVLAAAWHFLNGGRVRALHPPLVAALLFAAWSAASVFWAAEQEEVMTRSITNLQLLVALWLAWQIVPKGGVRALLAGFVAGCAVIVAMTWDSFLAGAEYSYGRFAAGGFDPNDMSVSLALGIPMAAYLAMTGRRRVRWLALVYLPVAVVGIFISGSRTGLLAAACAVAGVILWLALRSRPGLIAALALVGGGLTFAVLAVPPETLTRLLTATDGLSVRTAADREAIWRGGLELLYRHPIVGLGAGGFPDAVVSYVHLRIVAHSTALSVAVELGVIGLALFFGAFALVIHGVRRCATDQRALAWILVATWLVGSASLTWEFRKPTWLVLLVGATMATLRPGRDGSARP